MNWRHFLVLPLAALLLARPLHAPKLKPAIPPLKSQACDYPAARELYLRAYAYALENRDASLKLLGAAERECSRCGEAAGELALRIRSLRSVLLP